MLLKTALTGSLLAASASSSQARRTGLRAIMLLCDNVKDSNLGRIGMRDHSFWKIGNCNIGSPMVPGSADGYSTDFKGHNFANDKKAKLVYLQMVLCDKAPTPGSLRFARALPTSHWVTPSLIRRCLNLSAKASSSRGSVSASDMAMGGPCGWCGWCGWWVRGVWGLIMPPWVLYIDMEGWM